MDFVSTWQGGSTFIFTFALEVDDHLQQIEEDAIESEHSDYIVSSSPRFAENQNSPVGIVPHRREIDSIAPNFDVNIIGSFGGTGAEN
jgi:hypothetical protein